MMTSPDGGRFSVTSGQLAAAGGGWSAASGDLDVGEPPPITVSVFPSSAGMQVLISATQAAGGRFAARMNETGQNAMLASTAFGQREQDSSMKIKDVTGPVSDVLGSATGAIGVTSGVFGSLGGLINNVIGTATKQQGSQQNPNNYGGEDYGQHSDAIGDAQL